MCVYVRCIYIYMCVCLSWKEEFSPEGFELPFSLTVVVILWPPDVIKTSTFPLASRSCFHPLSSCKLCFATAFVLDKENSRVNWMSFGLARCPVKKQVNGNVLNHLKLPTIQLSPQTPGLTQLSWGWRQKAEAWSLPGIVFPGRAQPQLFSRRPARFPTAPR